MKARKLKIVKIARVEPKHAKVPNRGLFNWHGTSYVVYDLEEMVSFSVNPEESNKGDPNSNDSCGMSLGATRCFGTTTLIGDGACRILYHDDEPWCIRAWSTAGVKDAIKFQDSGQHVPAGEYELRPPPTNQGPDRTRKAKRPTEPLTNEEACQSFMQGNTVNPVTLAGNWKRPVSEVRELIEQWQKFGIKAKSAKPPIKRAKKKLFSVRAKLG